MTSERERIRRIAPVGEALRRPLWWAHAAGVVVATPLATTVLLATRDEPGVLRFLLSFAAFLVAGLATFLLALGPRTRKALLAFTWIGEHDLGRFLRETGSAPPTTIDGARRWLDAHPAAPGLHRVDVLLLAGALAEARAVAAALPQQTPVERFERELQLEYVARLSDEEENPELAHAAAELAGTEERRLAAAAVGMTRAARVAADGGDWRLPLVEARHELGRAATTTFARSRLALQVAFVQAAVGAAVCGVQLL